MLGRAHSVDEFLNICHQKLIKIKMINCDMKRFLSFKHDAELRMWSNKSNNVVDFIFFSKILIKQKINEIVFRSLIPM